ncbi:phage baseplate assembly protein domain-containing protein [Rhodopseudomonas palustris]|uniref:phage baseplate assembly protein domain-containing protein n=1 Tax=Rhodopseudomonas palustris TaxID=1076 RepID=UPI000CEC55F7|nr:phage baseplate assembly protein [Rhodopseudomonas palustris]PPQ42172.1 hypothetical protein CKO39_18450 [Rhodopseudomonas palustris]
MSYFEHDDALRSMLRRARVLKIDDSGTQQLLDLGGLKSERPEKIVRIQDHGFTSHPPKQAEGVMLQLGGRSSRTMFLGGEHKDHRPKNTAEGNAVLYDDKGNVVWMKSGDGIHLTAKKGQVELRSTDDKVWVKPGDGKKVYLGGDGTDGTYAAVMTEEGASINVMARVG